MPCSCIEDMTKRQIVTDYADLIVNDIFSTLGGNCPEVLDFVVEQVAVRMVHVLASIRHFERETDDPRVFDEVGKILHGIERRSPGVLNLVIQEYRARENADACH